MTVLAEVVENIQPVSSLSREQCHGGGQGKPAALQDTFRAGRWVHEPTITSCPQSPQALPASPQRAADSRSQGRGRAGRRLWTPVVGWLRSEVLVGRFGKASRVTGDSLAQGLPERSRPRH